MGGYQLSQYEWLLGLVLFIILFCFRVDTTIRIRRTKADDFYKNYKDVHQMETVKWLTMQYCKNDMEILCPEEVSFRSCYAAFDPPLRFVLGLSAPEEESNAIRDCSLRDLIDRSKWFDRKDANDLKEDELLTYFIAHVIEQVRIKSAERFRSDDGGILEFEQSRLIETTLTAIIHLFSTPTNLSTEGQPPATTATEFGVSGRVWSRDEVISCMNEAVLWHTQHKRHGSPEAGAILRLSRQQPSFVFKFLPLVREQIQFLEVDNEMENHFQKLYSFQTKEDELSFNHSQSDRCIWKHYEESSLISSECMMALETAPLKMRDLDWEGNFCLVLVHLYTWFSGAFAVWMVSCGRTRHRIRKKKRVTPPIEMEAQPMSNRSNRSLGSLSNRALRPTSSTSLLSVDQDGETERKSDQIRRLKWTCLCYLSMSVLLGIASSFGSETIRFSDFLDGICFVLLGFLLLRPEALTKCTQGSEEVDDKRRMFLDPDHNKHYKKWASVEFTEDF